MALKVDSSCINHPTIEAAGRCKQCGKPFCSACHVHGPTGNFCSEECRGKHEAFTKRAAELDAKRRKGGIGRRIWLLTRNVVIWALIVLLAVGIATYFGIEVPVLSDVVRSLVDVFN